MKTWKDVQNGVTPNNEAPPRDELSESTELISLDPSQLLPVQISTNALVVAKQRMDLYNHIICGYCVAHERLQKIGSKVSRQEEMQLAEGKLPEGRMNELAVISRQDQIALLHNRDALEETRVKLGLDKLRDQLLSDLYGTISFDQGFKMLADWVNLSLGIDCKTIQDINQLFPNLAVSEIAFFPLLSALPGYMLLYGTTFDSSSFAEEPDETYKGDEKRRIPQQGFATTQALAYVLDDYDPTKDDMGKLESDPYAVLGITGKRENVEFVPFSFTVEDVIQKLTFLLISNDRLFERVWTNSPEALQVGIGKIAATALRMILPEQDQPAADFNLSVAISSLEKAQRQAFEQKRAELERIIFQACIFDLSRKSFLDHDEVVKLVGILEKTPECLFKDGIFTGFIRPYGVFIDFILSDSSIVQSCSLSPVHQREAIEGLYYESQDSSRENRTITNLFSDMVLRAQKMAADKFVADPLSVSLLEQTVMSIWIDRGIAVQAFPVISLEETRDWSQLLERTVTGKAVIMEMTAKIGLQEARQIATTLLLLDRKILSGVKRLTKTRAMNSLSTLMKGMVIEGTYEPSSKTVSLVEFLDLLYSNLTPIQKASRSFVLLHECGEAIWSDLDAGAKNRWKKISWPRKSRQKLQKHFLTFYGHHVNEKEDFCDHFSAYVLHGPEFRLAATQATALNRKYRFIRSLIFKLCGQEIEFPRFFKWTLRQIQGAIEQEVNEKSLEEALEFDERRYGELYKDAREHIFEIRQSFEALFAESVTKSNAEDSGDDEGESDDDNCFDEEDFDSREMDEPETFGVIETHELRESVGDALETVMDRGEPGFKTVRDQIIEAIIDEDQEDLESALDFLDEDDRDELVSLLEEISGEVYGL